LRRISGDGVGAAFSPGGRRIAYATNYQLGIRVQRANGRGPERRLTTGYDYDPDWSPSGRRLVFTRYSQDGSLEEIWIRYASGERRLAEGGDPAWSVKGWIAFERDGDIYVVRPDGSRLRRVVRGRDPDWSPGGRRIVFTTHRGMISTVRPDVGGLQRLQSGSEPAFSPDGHKIVYIGRQGSRSWAPAVSTLGSCPIPTIPTSRGREPSGNLTGSRFPGRPCPANGHRAIATRGSVAA
jgi:Tol biopolymer transport system component